MKDLTSQEQIILIRFHSSTQLLTLKINSKSAKSPKGSQATKAADPGLNVLGNSYLRDLFYLVLASISNPFHSFPLEMCFQTVKICLERLIYTEKAVSRSPTQRKGKMK